MTMSSASASPPPPERSNFVTVIAWNFIVLSGFATAMSIMQNVMVSHLPLDEMSGQTGQAPADAPLFAETMIGHMRMLFLLFLVLSATTVTAAIGLLNRWNWARWLFISLLVLGIVWSIGKALPQFVMLAFWLHAVGDGSPETPVGLDRITAMMIGFSLVPAIGFAILFGWIIKRLVSPDIRREFAAL